MTQLKIKGTFTIETTTGFVINYKVIDLLREIDKTGSLKSAVANLGMSYSYAWNMINKTNCKLEVPLMISRRGGNGGGLAQLTAAGEALLRYCNNLEEDITDFIGTHKMDVAP